jgi:hypothetical protein
MKLLLFLLLTFLLISSFAIAHPIINFENENCKEKNGIYFCCGGKPFVIIGRNYDFKNCAERK